MQTSKLHQPHCIVAVGACVSYRCLPLHQQEKDISLQGAISDTNSEQKNKKVVCFCLGEKEINLFTVANLSDRFHASCVIE
jgi:hypothetical protein